MAAIITEYFRKSNALRFLAALQDSVDTYYVGLGKNDPWLNDPIPAALETSSGGIYKSSDILQNLIAMKKVEEDDTFIVIPKVKWTLSNIYKAWDPADTLCFYASGNLNPCYVVDDSNNLYLCVKSPKTVVTQAPSSTTGVGEIFTTSDGYSWVLLQLGTSIDTATSGKLLTNKWYPLVTIGEAPDATEDGKVIRVDIVNGGSNYVTNATQALNIYGDGGALQVTVGTGTTGTAITSATFTYTNVNNVDFTYGNVLESDITSGLRGSSGSGAEFRVVVVPSGGFGGYNNIKVLPAWFVGLPAIFTDDGLGDWPIAVNSTDFRQISLIRNPSFNVGAVLTGGRVSTLRSASYSGTPPQVGGVLKKANGTTAYVDYVDTGSSKVYFHGSLSARNFNSEPITEGDYTVYTAAGTIVSGVCSLSTIVEPEYQQFTGDVVFIENRGPIARSDGQTEDIKVVIQF